MTSRLVASIALLLMSCASTAQLALPADLREVADRYSVGGHVTALQRKLRFGPYTATKAFVYKSEDHREATLFNGQKERFEAHQHGGFTLKTASGTFKAKCEQAQASVTQHEKSLEYRSVNGEGGLSIRDERVAGAHSRIYGCEIAQPHGSSLRLSQHDSQDGIVEGDGVRWSLALLYELAQPPALAAGIDGGFVVSEGEGVLGVVGTSYERASVTFSRELDGERRDQFAAVAAALLLLREM